MLYSMKQVCEQTGMTYQGLKFYCNIGLVPNVKRDKNNCRVFDERDIAWIKSLACLKKCGMGINEMKDYTALCLQGVKTINQRKEILNNKRAELLNQIKMLQDSINYIDNKQKFYDQVLTGETEYISNLIPCRAC